GDRDDRSLRGSERLNRRGDVEIGPEPSDQLPCGLPFGLALRRQQIRPAAGSSQRQILNGAQHRDETKILMDDVNLACGGAPVQLSPVPTSYCDLRTWVGGINAGQDLRQCRLSRTVLADEGHNLSL